MSTTTPNFTEPTELERLRRESETWREAIAGLLAVVAEHAEAHGHQRATITRVRAERDQAMAELEALRASHDRLTMRVTSAGIAEHWLS